MDKAHAMALHQGSGEAGQVIEDSCILAELLGHHLANRGTLPDILRICDAIRGPFALDIAHRSYENGRYISMSHDDFQVYECGADEQQKRLEEMGKVIIDKWRWAWSTSLDVMIGEGISVLEGAVPDN
ncbi:hypothetical protein DXG01_007395 [Tephrocybe rancida]|nr:hypothetical protein DXG01_007395 [Tephrocybe rancida]